MKKLIKKPKINSLVRFIIPKEKGEYPFLDGDTLLFLGEIKNMPEHCIVVNKNGKIFFGYHTENFIQIKDDDC